MRRAGSIGCSIRRACPAVGGAPGGHDARRGPGRDDDLDAARRERQAGEELEKLVAVARAAERPDVVCLSNVLLAGSRGRSGRRSMSRSSAILQASTRSSNALRESDRAEAWDVLRERVRDIEGFVASSGFYRREMIDRLGLPPERVAVCLETASRSTPTCRRRPRRIPRSWIPGAHWCRGGGLDTLAEALILIKARGRAPRFRLRARPAGRPRTMTISSAGVAAGSRRKASPARSRSSRTCSAPRRSSSCGLSRSSPSRRRWARPSASSSSRRSRWGPGRAAPPRAPSPKSLRRRAAGSSASPAIPSRSPTGSKRCSSIRRGRGVGRARQACRPRAFFGGADGV